MISYKPASKLVLFRVQISCQRNNYLKSQNNYMYVLNISLFQLSDILVFIADIHKIQKRDTYGNIPVVEAFGRTFPTEWSSLNTRKPEYFSALKKY